MTDEKRSYSLPTQRMPGLNLSHHLRDLTEIRAMFESRGIQTKNTRIERYTQYLEQSLRDGAGTVDAEKIFKNSNDERFRHPVDWHLYVLREVHELMWILKGLKANAPIGVDEKLKLIAGGSDFAALDLDSQSRNAQFELRIASYFCQGGWEVDVSTDTDVIASRGRYTFFVECKRVGSRKRLAPRLSEARRQLAERMPREQEGGLVLGCIAADVTRVAFKHNGLTWGITSEHSRDVIQDKLKEIGGDDRLFSFESPARLMCYWLQIHIPTLIMQPLPVMCATRFSSYHVPRPSMSQRDAYTLAAFYYMFESVSKDDARSLRSRQLTPRDRLIFPAGTMFSLNDVRVLELLEKATISEDEQAEVIGALHCDGIERKFSFFEVRLLPDDVIEEWRRELSADRVKGCGHLLALLYLRRYPYEESEEIAKSGAAAVYLPPASDPGE